LEAVRLSRSTGLGVTWGLVAGVGAWLQVTPGEAFTLRAVDILWLTLAATGLVGWLTLRRGVPTRTFAQPTVEVAYWIFMTAMILAPLLGVIANGAPLTATSTSLRFAMFATVPWLLVSLRVDRSAFWSGLSVGLGVAVVLNLIYGSLQMLEFGGVIPSRSLPHHALAEFLPDARFDNPDRAAGLFLHPNHLGYFGGIAALIFASRLLVAPRSLWFVLMVAALLLALVSNSRSALVLAIASAAAMFFLVLTARRVVSARLPALIGVAGVGLIGAAIALVTLEPLARTFNVSRFVRVVNLAVAGLDADGSLQKRVMELWPRALEVLDQYPLGYGAEPARFFGTIDSAWITYLVQGSWPLVALFATFLLGAMFSGVVLNVTRGSQRAERAAGLALFGSTFTLAIGSLVLSPMHVPAVMMLFLATWFTAAGSAPHRSGAGAA
jgi:hypothetical protein